MDTTHTRRDFIKATAAAGTTLAAAGLPLPAVRAAGSGGSPVGPPRRGGGGPAGAKTVSREKPVAVDGPGIRTCLTLCEEAKTKRLGVGAGTQRRHEHGYIEAVKRVREGARWGRRGAPP